MADAATWKKHVAAWRASGETAAAYGDQLTSSSSTCPARPRPRSASSSAASAVTSRPTPRASTTCSSSRPPLDDGEPDLDERHEVGCWSHCRRKAWEVAITSEDPVAREAVLRIKRIFDLDRSWRSKPPDDTRAVPHIRIPQIGSSLVVAVISWPMVEQRSAEPGSDREAAVEPPLQVGGQARRDHGSAVRLMILDEHVG